jgi:hypothetical protein
MGQYWACTFYCPLGRTARSRSWLGIRRWVTKPRRRSICPAPSALCLGLADVFELTFPNHPFKRFPGILDAVLVVAAVTGQEPHDLIGAIADHVADRTRREQDGLAKSKLVFFQRGSPDTRTRLTCSIAEQLPHRSVTNIPQICNLSQNFLIFAGK